MLLSAATLLSLGLAAGARVTLDNTRPRRTVDGVLMDAHDGNVMQWTPGGLYYLYAMGYGNCTEKDGWIPPFQCPGIYKPFGACGFRTDHALNVYSSPDLVNWTFAGDALSLESRPTGIYFRPKVVYNERTGEYVLWINLLYQSSVEQTPLDAYPNATYLVATSASPTGPFAVVNASVFLQASGAG